MNYLWGTFFMTMRSLNDLKNAAPLFPPDVIHASLPDTLSIKSSS